MNIDKTEKEQDSQNPEKKDQDQATLVLVQFTDLDDANYSQQFSAQLKSLEITSPNPIIQIGNRLYTGEYTNNLGTYLFFEEKQKQTDSSNPIAGNLNANSCSEFEYFGKTFKKLVLTRLFVEENASASSPTSPENSKD